MCFIVEYGTGTWCSRYSINKHHGLHDMEYWMSVSRWYETDFIEYDSLSSTGTRLREKKTLSRKSSKSKLFSKLNSMILTHLERLSLRAAVVANRLVTASMLGVSDRWICSIIRHSRRFSSIEALSSGVGVRLKVGDKYCEDWWGAVWGGAVPSPVVGLGTCHRQKKSILR